MAVVAAYVDHAVADRRRGKHVIPDLEQPSEIGIVAAAVLMIRPGVGNNITAGAGRRRL